MTTGPSEPGPSEPGRRVEPGGPGEPGRPTPPGPAAERPYRRLSPLTPLARSGILVVAVLATTWDDILRGEVGPFAWMLLALLVAGAVYGAASWLRTKYWIEADELRVDTGVISRQSRRIRIDRLQGIDIVQPFIARLLGLAELRMDVAGGNAREGSLAFLTLQDARELKDVLLARRDQVRAATEDGADEVAAERGGVGPGGAGQVEASEASASRTGVGQGPVPGTTGRSAAPPERPIARVDLGLLLLSIVLSGETLGLLGAAFAFGAMFLATGEWAGFSAMIPVVGGILLVQFRKLAGSYNFTVSETPAGLQVRRGLFELNSQTIALPRLQGIVVSEPLLWRAFGWARLDVSIAGYGTGGDEGPSASTVMPVADKGLVLALARHMLEGLDHQAVPVTPPPPQARWVAPVGHRFMAAGIGEELVVSREGWWTRRTHVVPHARVQSLRLSQGPWQRLHGVADLHVDSPPGPVHVRARHRLGAQARGMLEHEAVLARAARRPASFRKAR